MPKIDVKVSSEAFDEFTGALNDAGIKLGKDDEITITKDMAVKGPINYRQVNLRHQILIEVAKVYKTPIQKDFEVSNSAHFIDFLDDVYKYILEGKDKTTDNKTKTPAKSGWGNNT